MAGSEYGCEHFAFGGDNSILGKKYIDHMAFSSFMNSVILLGALQGFIIGVVLLRSSSRKPSARLLGWLLCIFALACFKIYIDSVSLLSSQVGLFVDAIVPFFIIMPVGPLIYFYCKAELHPGFELQRKDRRHFYTIFIDIFHHISALIFIFILLLGFGNPQKNNFGVWFDAYNVYSDVPRWISLTIYLGFSYRLVRKERITNSSAHALPWLKEFLSVFIVFDFLWLFYLVPYVIPKYTDVVLNNVGWYPIYIPLVVIVYWLGLRTLQVSRNETGLSKKPAALNLPEPMIDQLMDKIVRAMSSDKLYLDVDLTLIKLARHVGSSPKIVSAVLNQKLGKGFNEYINQFRIEEVKSRLIKRENKKYTIASVAYDCGFNSQPTFQRAFKSLVGVTPREFMQQHGDTP